jgi:hypothetical protein
VLWQIQVITSFADEDVEVPLASGSPLASTFASSSFQTALQNAPSGELVELGAQALRLHETNLLFADSSPVSSATAASDSITAVQSTVEASAATAAGADAAADSAGRNSSSAPLAAEAAALEGGLQSEDIQGLFGLGSVAQSGSILNAIG